MLEAGVTAKEAASILGVTEGAVYKSKKRLGAYRTAGGWMFDRRLIETERASKSGDGTPPALGSAADAETAAKVFEAIDEGLTPTDIVKRLEEAPF